MVIQNREHHETAAYRWVDVMPDEVERLHAVARGALVVKPSPRGGFVAQVELLSSDDADVVRRAVRAAGDSKTSRGIWLSVASELYEDGMLTDAFVRDLIVDVGGQVDFSFTAFPFDDEGLPTRPDRTSLGTRYGLRVPHLHAEQSALLRDELPMGSVELQSPDEKGAVHAFVNLETDAACLTAANILAQTPLLSRPTLVASLVTVNDNDGIEVDSCVIDLLRRVRCDLQFSYSVVDSGEPDCI
ncbi:MAG TPA: hypothetical protein DCP20_04370 [Coriobacteriia bacterium]|nr:MAG: hypothetical protein XD74_0495 [Actinobacteria bacterium 66_15]HAL29938.1 hypothetical protein [Coriobacteriia bacterium]